jgi:hypothetical protein
MSKEYKTFAEQFYVEEDSLGQRIRRDLRLLLWLLQNIINWFKSRKVRAEFERCRASGEPFYVDRFTGPPAKK